MSSIPLTRQQLDAAGEIDFDARRKPAQDITLTVHAMLDGFPVELCFQGDIERLHAVVARLRTLGAEPVSAPPQAPVHATAVEKFCPIHGDPMKPMSRPDKSGATHWCTKKVGDGFCKERA